MWHEYTYEASGTCEVIEDDALSTYWCTDLADFFSQVFAEYPD